MPAVRLLCQRGLLFLAPRDGLSLSHDLLYRLFYTCADCYETKVLIDRRAHAFTI